MAVTGKRGAKAGMKKTVKAAAGKGTDRTAARKAASKAPAEPMVLNIDYSLCRGCGGCAEAFPRLFEMREERAWIINPGEFDVRRHEGVLKICPYYAISVERAA
ncbi:MAG: hypothetical protein M0042_07415 [Nitrospiraceae bacterium]|nr:hypothetical protein [Nitrospiraceae bacterium]